MAPSDISLGPNIVPNSSSDLGLQPATNIGARAPAGDVNLKQLKPKRTRGVSEDASSTQKLPSSISEGTLKRPRSHTTGHKNPMKGIGLFFQRIGSNLKDKEEKIESQDVNASIELSNPQLEKEASTISPTSDKPPLLAINNEIIKANSQSSIHSIDPIVKITISAPDDTQSTTLSAIDKSTLPKSPVPPSPTTSENNLRRAKTEASKRERTEGAPNARPPPITRNETRRKIDIQLEKMQYLQDQYNYLAKRVDGISIDYSKLMDPVNASKLDTSQQDAIDTFILESQVIGSRVDQNQNQIKEIQNYLRVGKIDQQDINSQQTETLMSKMERMFSEKADKEQVNKLSTELERCKSDVTEHQNRFMKYTKIVASKLDDTDRSLYESSKESRENFQNLNARVENLHLQKEIDNQPIHQEPTTGPSTLVAENPNQKTIDSLEIQELISPLQDSISKLKEENQNLETKLKQQQTLIESILETTNQLKFAHQVNDEKLLKIVSDHDDFKYSVTRRLEDFEQSAKDLIKGTQDTESNLDIKIAQISQQFNQDMAFMEKKIIEQSAKDLIKGTQDTESNLDIKIAQISKQLNQDMAFMEKKIIEQSAKDLLKRTQDTESNLDIKITQISQQLNQDMAFMEKKIIDATGSMFSKLEAKVEAIKDDNRTIRKTLDDLRTSIESKKIEMSFQDPKLRLFYKMEHLSTIPASQQTRNPWTIPSLRAPLYELAYQNECKPLD